MGNGEDMRNGRSHEYQGENIRLVILVFGGLIII
jgi:hypothetical protein